MKRIFLLKGLDCPNCSAKIEKEVGELDGVQSSDRKSTRLNSSHTDSSRMPSSA